jgi:hypothetical protein
LLQRQLVEEEILKDIPVHGQSQGRGIKRPLSVGNFDGSSGPPVKVGPHYGQIHPPQGILDSTLFFPTSHEQRKKETFLLERSFSSLSSDPSTLIFFRYSEARRGYKLRAEEPGRQAD